MSRKDESLWLRDDADRGEWRDAERARQNRREIQHALSSGEVSGWTSVNTGATDPHAGARTAMAALPMCRAIGTRP